MKRRGLAALAALLCVSGCTFIKVVTFNEDTLSYKLKGQTVVVSAIREGVGSIPYLTGNDKAAVEAKCGIVSSTSPTAFALPAAAILLGGTIVFNELTAALQSYIEAEKEKFQKDYGGAVNVGAFAVSGASAVRCIRIQRFLANPADPAKPEIAMDFIVSLEAPTPLSNALVMRPVYLALNKSAARTGADAGIDLDIGVGISLVRNVNGQNELYALAQKNFTFSGVPLRTVVAAPPAADSKVKFVDSSVFPIPSQMPTGATIAVAVQETGSGADAFGDAAKSLERNKGAIKDALDGFLNAKFGTP